MRDGGEAGAQMRLRSGADLLEGVPEEPEVDQRHVARALAVHLAEAPEAPAAPGALVGVGVVALDDLRAELEHGVLVQRLRRVGLVGTLDLRDREAEPEALDAGARREAPRVPVAVLGAGGAERHEPPLAEVAGHAADLAEHVAGLARHDLGGLDLGGGLEEGAGRVPGLHPVEGAVRGLVDHDVEALAERPVAGEHHERREHVPAAVLGGGLVVGQSLEERELAPGRAGLGRARVGGVLQRVAAVGHAEDHRLPRAAAHHREAPDLADRELVELAVAALDHHEVAHAVALADGADGRLAEELLRGSPVSAVQRGEHETEGGRGGLIFWTFHGELPHAKRIVRLTGRRTVSLTLFYCNNLRTLTKLHHYRNSRRK